MFNKKKLLLGFILLLLSINCKYGKYLQYVIEKKPINLPNALTLKSVNFPLAGKTFDLQHDCDEPIRSEFSKEIKFTEEQNVKEITYSSGFVLSKDGVNTTNITFTDIEYGNYFVVNNLVFISFNEDSHLPNSSDIVSDKIELKTKKKEPIQIVLHFALCKKENKTYEGLWGDWGFYKIRNE